MVFCFMAKKDHFKQNLVFFKDSILPLDYANFMFTEETSSKACLVNSQRNSWEGNRDSEMPFPFFKIRFSRIELAQ